MEVKDEMRKKFLNLLHKAGELRRGMEAAGYHDLAEEMDETIEDIEIFLETGCIVRWTGYVGVGEP